MYNPTKLDAKYIYKIYTLKKKIDKKTMNNKNHNYEKKKSNEKKGKRYKNKMQGMMVKGV